MFTFTRETSICQGASFLYQEEGDDLISGNLSVEEVGLKPA